MQMAGFKWAWDAILTTLYHWYHRYAVCRGSYPLARPGGPAAPPADQYWGNVRVPGAAGILFWSAALLAIHGGGRFPCLPGILPDRAGSGVLAADFGNLSHANSWAGDVTCFGDHLGFGLAGHSNVSYLVGPSGSEKIILAVRFGLRRSLHLLLPHDPGNQGENAGRN